MTLTTTAILVDLTVQALLAADTDAGERIYTPGDWPTKTGTFPVLLVQGIREQKESIGRGTIEFTVVSTIRITARTSAPGAPDDQGGEDAEEKLWRLQRQIECAVINADWRIGSAQRLSQYPSVRSQLAMNSEGQVQVGELLMEIEMEYYQGPEAFYPVPTAPLDEITAQVVMPDHTTRPGFDISFV
ncbi:MAG TPA: hypothetical protein VFB02_13865 [Bradyrhizobium sp.]|nr:hypothetical protein [Bradyrhizobium sp.]